MKIDKEFKSLIPPLGAEELAQLEENLKRDGCRDALVTWNDLLLDGHNRKAICERLDISYKEKAIKLADRDAAKIWIIQNQFGRRNLAAFTRAELALLLEPLFAKRNKEAQIRGGKEKVVQNSAQPASERKTRSEVAKAAGLSHDTIAKSKIITEHANEETKKKLRENKTTINRVANDIKREQKQKEHAKRKEAAKQTKLTTPKGPFNLVLADPPWQYDESKENRKIENHYDTAMVSEIVSHLPDTLAENCVLFMWATAPKLVEAIEVMRGWGFLYRTHAIWDKQKIGMGYWFRGQHELLLVGIRGKMKTPTEQDRRSSIFTEERGKHSKKPECVYQWIEETFPGHAKLEMYCREPREGWAAWGNEI